MTAYASTLLAVAVKKNRYIALHLGDGVIGCRYEQEQGDSEIGVRVLSVPENGEHANETVFFTSLGAQEHLRMYAGQLKGTNEVIDGFILMSDGPESALYRKTDSSLAPVCGKLLLSLRDMEKRKMQKSLNATVEMIASSMTCDDCSLALMVHV